MRVLLTTDTIGGVWTYTKELTENLLEHSHSVALVSFGRFPSPSQHSWCATMETLYPLNFSYTASDAPLEWMQNNELAYSAAEAPLLDLVQSFNADLIHTNQFCFGKLPTPTPKLIVAHSDVLSWAAACRPQALDPSPWLERYRDLVQTGLSAADAVVAPTEWMRQALAQNFSLPSKTGVIPNGRDVPPTSVAPPRKLQAVSAGRLWDEAKNLSLLCDAESPFPIFVAGETQHETTSAPPSLGSATLLGPQDEQQLLDLFRSSSIYLALSLYEPFGLAPLEAALCGCAVIANDIPSLREVWGSAALYFQGAHSLSFLLAQLASDPKLLETWQHRASHRAHDLSRAQMTGQYIDLYQQLLHPTSALPKSAEAPAHVS